MTVASDEDSRMARYQRSQRDSTRARRTYARKRGLCPVCRREYSLRKDITMAFHVRDGSLDPRECAGVGMAPSWVVFRLVTP